VEFGIKTALAINCTVNADNRFARKHYYYPTCRRTTRSASTKSRWPSTAISTSRSRGARGDRHPAPPPRGRRG
jgi:hypothetical protein